MMRRRSVVRRLKRGLAAVGLFGTLLLLVAVAFFYSFAFSQLEPRAAVARAFKEMMEHVALPVAVLMIPVFFVALGVIRQAFKPLRDAATRIQTAQGQERGFRIDDREMPSEALPFTTAVNDLLARADEAARRHEAFAADVAHELRTPLALLSLELDRLDHPDAPRLKGDVATMRRLIEQLMLLAQIDADTIAQTPLEEVSLAEVAQDVVTRHAPGIIAEGKTIALDELGPPKVLGRREAIAAALRNLVENATRVTPPGGAITVFVGPGSAIRVRDGGLGLEPSHLEQLVRRHCRADHASRTGAGLGLAIVDRIMAAHEGRLSTEPRHRELQLHFPQMSNEG